MKIDRNTCSILENCRIEGNTIFHPEGQLERKDYIKVNKCLDSIGGKWNRKLKGHLFEDDPAPLLDNLILTGETTDIKKELQFFPTPENIAADASAMMSASPAA